MLTRPRCVGVGEPPAEVVVEPYSYRLRDGSMHTMPGRGDCPACGRRVSFRPVSGVVFHRQLAEITDEPCRVARVEPVRIPETDSVLVDGSCRVGWIKRLHDPDPADWGMRWYVECTCGQRLKGVDPAAVRAAIIDHTGLPAARARRV